MECLWRLFSHRLQVRYCHHPYSAIFYLRFDFDNGFTNYSLHGACFLEECPQVYPIGQAEPLVLSLIKENEQRRNHLQSRNCCLVPGRLPSLLISRKEVKEY